MVDLGNRVVSFEDQERLASQEEIMLGDRSYAKGRLNSQMMDMQEDEIMLGTGSFAGGKRTAYGKEFNEMMVDPGSAYVSKQKTVKD